MARKGTPEYEIWKAKFDAKRNSSTLTEVKTVSSLAQRILDNKAKALILEEKLVVWEDKKAIASAKVYPTKRDFQYSTEYRDWRYCNRETSSLERQLEDLAYDVTYLRSFMTKFIKPTIVAHTTAVKGYHDYTDGKKVYSGLIEVKGSQFKPVIEKIKAALLEEGYTLYGEVSSHFATGWIWSIRYNAIYAESNPNSQFTYK